MPSLTIQIKGADEFAGLLKNSREITAPILARTLNHAAFYLLQQALGYAPHATGHLKSSLTVKEASPSDDPMTAQVGTNLKYAPWQEFGTGIYAGRPPIRPKTAKVLRFVTRDGKVVFARQVRGTPAIRYMQRARDDTLPVLDQNIKKALQFITERLAKE